jgi:hypothetical protein
VIDEWHNEESFNTFFAGPPPKTSFSIELGCPPAQCSPCSKQSMRRERSGPEHLVTGPTSS